MLRIRWALAGAIVLSLALGACGAGYRTPTNLHTIMVTGTARTRLAPDIVLLTLGVQTQGRDVAEAVSENNRRSAEVVGVFRSAGVAGEDIQTTYFNVYPQQQYDQFGVLTGEVVYWVDNTITVKVRQLDQVGVLLQSVLTRGANTVQGLSYTVEDPSDALDAIRADALEDARMQAEQLAASAGVELGEVLTISESGALPSPVYEAAAFGKGGGGGVPTQAGSLEYSVSMTVTYEAR
jgi:uncharacterized protein YggE